MKQYGDICFSVRSGESGGGARDARTSQQVEREDNLTFHGWKVGGRRSSMPS